MVVGVSKIFHRFLALSFFLSVGVAGFVDIALAQVSPVGTSTYTDGTFNQLFERIARSFEGFPGLISAAAYLVGLMLAITGAMKLKDYADDPRSTPLRESLIRFLIGGALFAFPSVMVIATSTIGQQSGAVETGMMINSTAAATGGVVCDVSASAGGLAGALFGSLTGGTMSSMICGVASAFSGLPGLIGVILYFSGMIVLFWGLMQLRDHVLSPTNVPLPVPLKKILVAGIFFAFPTFLEVVYNTFAGDYMLYGTDILTTLSSVMGWLTGAPAPGSCGGASSLGGSAGGAIGTVIGVIGGASPTSSVGGLDCMFIRLISDVSGPLQYITSIFCYLAGIIIIIIAVRRLMDSTDKGIRGPLGMGTFAMLALGGILLSFNTLLGTVSATIFPSLGTTAGVISIYQNASLTYAPGVGSAGITSINSVLTSVLAFSFLLGMFSVLRGLFILKDVADGGQASIMAGITHVIGGGMAINLGSLIGAVQNTLGLSSVGLAFS